MQQIICIGFDYLPGSLVDLYRFSRKFHHCIIMTNFSRAKFPSTCKYHYIDPTQRMNYQLIDRLRPYFSKKSEVSTIIYYTGHGVERHWKLPDNSLFPISKLFRWTQTAPLIGIFDCCGLGPISLPYRLNRTRFHLISDPMVTGENNSRILFLTSFKNQEDSFIHPSGSPFTYQLMNSTATTFPDLIQHLKLGMRQISPHPRPTIWASCSNPTYPNFLISGPLNS